MEDEYAIIDDLILAGALEIAGIDANTGEFLYSVTPKLQDIMPELYQEHMDNVNKDIMTLWERGFVDMNFNDDNPIVNLNPKAHNYDEINRLPKHLISTLDEIKRHILG
jgi:hypothetical protein